VVVLSNPVSAFGGVIRWGQSLANELVRAPETLRTARLVVDDLEASIPELTATVRSLTTELETTLRDLSVAVAGGMNDRLEHLDSVVSDLGRTLTALIGGIPGARRALRATERPG
jgi:hypothetical protein